MNSKTPIVVTGGDTAHGEVVRGEVCLIHYDEAEARESYCKHALEAARAIQAPQVVIESLEALLEAHTAV